MQYVIDIRPDQDLQFLLTFLEKMQVVYRPVDLVNTNIKRRLKKAPVSGTRASKYRGKLSAKTADALHKHVNESRNEWERTF